MKENKELFRCDYFTVEELAVGVYAAIATEEGGALSNSGIIDLGDMTVVFDTFLSVDAARKLRKLAEDITGRKTAYVMNSHSHFDHILGNCAFDLDTQIIAAQKIHNELKAHQSEIDDMKRDVPHIISSLREKLQCGLDEMSKKMIERDIKYFEMVGKESFRLRLPDTVFEGSI
ncbi:MAG: MBL fold metallo-hydrolase [Clostridia bacterium]